MGVENERRVKNGGGETGQRNNISNTISKLISFRWQVRGKNRGT
jgi:hypothetical protein